MSESDYLPGMNWNQEFPDVDRIGGYTSNEGQTLVCNSGPVISYSPPPDDQLCGVVFSDLDAIYGPLDACTPNAAIEIVDCVAIHRTPYRYHPNFDSYIDCLNEQGARVPVGEDGYKGGGVGLSGIAGIDGAFCWKRPLWDGPGGGGGWDLRVVLWGMLWTVGLGMMLNRAAFRSRGVPFDG